MMISRKIKALLGFAQKSGQLFSGEKAVKNCLKVKKAQIVLLAADFSEKRKNLIRKWCSEQKVPCFVWGTKEAFGEILGTTPRSLLVLTDQEMAERVCQYLSKAEEVR